MEIVIAEKGAFCFEPAISLDEARGRASAHKGAAFGTLSRLFSRPKDEDVTISDLGLCYLPVWHAKVHLRFVYDRSDSYKVSVKSPHVATVTVNGNDYVLAAGAIDVPVVEHCERDEQRELWIDAVSSHPVDPQAYLKARATPIDTTVTATMVESASPTVASNWASATVRRTRPSAWSAGGVKPFVSMGLGMAIL